MYILNVTLMETQEREDIPKRGHGFPRGQLRPVVLTVAWTIVLWFLSYMLRGIIKG